MWLQLEGTYLRLLPCNSCDRPACRWLHVRWHPTRPSYVSLTCTPQQTTGHKVADSGVSKYGNVNHQISLPLPRQWFRWVPCALKQPVISAIQQSLWLHCQNKLFEKWISELNFYRKKPKYLSKPWSLPLGARGWWARVKTKATLSEVTYREFGVCFTFTAVTEKPVLWCLRSLRHLHGEARRLTSVWQPIKVSDGSEQAWRVWCPRTCQSRGCRQDYIINEQATHSSVL